MAPEQLEGKPSDHRTDIFAFGAVVYEMVTGTRAFGGHTQASVIGAILRDSPHAVTAGRPPVPAELDRLINKAIAKDPEARWQSAHDLGDEIAWVAEQGAVSPVGAGMSASAAYPNGAGRPARSRTVLLVASAAALAALITWLVATPEPVERQARRFEIPVEASVAIGGGLTMALSPDGQTLVYMAMLDGQLQLLQRRMNRLEAAPIPGTANGRSPFLSPDGRSVGFFTERQLKTLRLDGGAASTLQELEWRAGPSASWGEDGTILYSSVALPGIMRISVDGGEPEQVTAVDSESELAHLMPSWLPGGRAFLFTVVLDALDSEARRIAVSSLDTGEQTLLTTGTDPSFLPSGHLLFARSDDLWVAPYDPEDPTTLGEPRPVVRDVAVGTLGKTSSAVAMDGSLVYLPRPVAMATTRLVWVDRRGQPEVFAPELAHYAFPRFSSNGRRLAVAIGEAHPFLGPSDLWLYEIGRGARARLTFDSDPSVRYFPTWAGDSERLIYQAGGDLHWIPADGGTQSELLFDGRVRGLFPFSFSSRHQALAAYNIFTETGRDILTLTLDEAADPRPFLVTEFEERSPSFSPNGDWLAYVSDESGQPEVYVAPYPAADGKTPISTNGGAEPVWSRDGTSLFYRTARELMAVTFDPATGRAGDPVVRFVDNYVRDESGGAVSANYDVAPDGDRFVMIDRVESGTSDSVSFHVVVDWFEELKNQVPVN